MFRVNLQNEQLNVLSYHMIDVFTLPSTLQAYIQQLETSRIRLSQLEQQVQVARVQVLMGHQRQRKCSYCFPYINSSTSSVLEGPIMAFATELLIFFMYMQLLINKWMLIIYIIMFRASSWALASSQVFLLPLHLVMGYSIILYFFSR